MRTPRTTAMGENYERLFVVLTPEQPPMYLCERILAAVERERTRSERVRFVVSSLTGMGSLVGLMFALPALMRAASVTGFSSYAPLLVSDTDLIVSHFNTFGFTILESLPGYEVTITLFLLAVFLVSLKNFICSIAPSGFRLTFRITRISIH